MGRGHTYNVIGYAPLTATTSALYTAMSKTGMAQAVHKAGKLGHKIVYWDAQTKIGYKLLGNEWTADTKDLTLPRLSTCSICQGAGCPVCNFSGVCKRGNELRWQEWQFEDMKVRYSSPATGRQEGDRDERQG